MLSPLSHTQDLQKHWSITAHRPSQRVPTWPKQAHHAEASLRPPQTAARTSFGTDTAQASFTDTVLEKTQASALPSAREPWQKFRDRPDFIQHNTGATEPDATQADAGRKNHLLPCWNTVHFPLKATAYLSVGSFALHTFPPLSISRLNLLPWLQFSHANKSASKCSPVGPPFLPRLGS